MALGRKKIQRPKNPLGYALYRYDKILDIDLRKIIDAIKLNKKVNAKRANPVVQKAVYSLDGIADDISKDNFKTDYRSDKTRDVIIDLFLKLKRILQNAEELSYVADKLEGSNFLDNLNETAKLRESLKLKMKDIESDYI